MSLTHLLPILLTGFGVALLHSAIPTHWLPFVVAARVQKWPLRKTLFITLIASAAHAAFTACLGLVVVSFGASLFERYESWFHYLSGSALILFGIYIVYQQRFGGGHSHFLLHRHDHSVCEFDSTEAIRVSGGPRRSDRVAVLSLIGALFLSPCEVILPIYLSAVEFGWQGFFFLSAVLASASTIGMLSLVAVASLGSLKFKFRQLERIEISAMGVLLCLLGVLVIVLGH
ncbi:MAG: hypothetical protein AB7F86_13010 [Bdellovibrionales bacterium]